MTSCQFKTKAWFTFRQVHLYKRKGERSWEGIKLSIDSRVIPCVPPTPIITAPELTLLSCLPAGRKKSGLNHFHLKSRKTIRVKPFPLEEQVGINYSLVYLIIALLITNIVYMAWICRGVHPRQFTAFVTHTKSVNSNDTSGKQYWTTPSQGPKISHSSVRMR